MIAMAVPKAIQIRDVPDDVHAAVRARAAAAGMSLSEYLREELLERLARPTVAEVIARAQARHGGASREAIVRVIREMRDGPGQP
jgi:antitoxin FitA